MCNAGIIALLLLVLSALAVSSCGSGESGSGNANAVVRAEFIAKAEAICERTDKVQRAAQIAFQEKFPQPDSSASWEKKLILVAAVPPIKAQAEELGRLETADGDEEAIASIVASMEDGVKGARSDPATLLQTGSPGPFTEAEKLARDYGFKACAKPM